MNSPISFSFWPKINTTNMDGLSSFEKIINNPQIGFFHWTKHSNEVEQVENIFKKFQHKKVFIHIGIGGSSLGPEMLISSLKKNHDVKFIFINNIDSDEIFDQLVGINPRDALFYVVSKSGTTAETMAAFSMMVKWGKFEPNELKDYFVFCTDPNVGDLRKMSKDFSIDCLTVPSSIGGRFSVLTAVGLFPAFFAEINGHELFKGAEKMKSIMLERNMDNPLIKSSNFLVNHKSKGFTQTVLMPYSSKLRNLSFWFVQLWAESLGKKKSIDGSIINTGLTPIPGYGATDQHSQMQLFMEGPFDKCLILIKVKNPKHNYDLKCELDYSSLKNLAKVTLNQLMEAELIGTIKALTEANRPHIIIEIDSNNEQTLGALIIFFESLTAFVGNELGIDPFDQPGVEAGKIYAWEHIRHSL
jgi:glucose-6-phosphate isomerase